MKPHAFLPTLEGFPVFNRAHGLKNFGYSLVLLREMVQATVAEIPHETAVFHQAYTQKNWQRIEDLAHKMKGVTGYIGLAKLQYACQYLERYQKAGLTKSLEPLYQQLLSIVLDTQNHIKQWLTKGINHIPA